MKTKIAMFLSLGITVAAFASPKVTCGLVYRKSDSNGRLVETKRGTPQQAQVGEELKIEVQGFVLMAYLVPFCIADAGCTDSHQLYTTITKNGISTDSVNYTPFHGQFLQLRLGDERVHASCDLTY